MFDAVWCVTAQASSPRIAQHCQTSLSCLLLGPPPPRQWPAPWLLNTLTLLLLSFVFLLSVEVGGQLNPRLNIVFCFIGHFPTIFLFRPLNFASMHRYNARIQADRCRQLSIVFTKDNTIIIFSCCLSSILWQFFARVPPPPISRELCVCLMWC